MKRHLVLLLWLCLLTSGCSSQQIVWDDFKSESRVIANNTVAVEAGQLFQIAPKVDGGDLIIRGAIGTACRNNVYFTLQTNTVYPEQVCRDQGDCTTQSVKTLEDAFLYPKNSFLCSQGKSEAAQDITVTVKASFPTTSSYYTWEGKFDGDGTFVCKGCVANVRKVAAFCGTATLAVTPKLPPTAKLDSEIYETPKNLFQGLRYQIASLSVPPLLARSLEGLGAVEKGVVYSCLDSACLENALQSSKKDCTDQCTRQHSPPQCISDYRECLVLDGGRNVFAAICNADYQKCLAASDFQTKFSECNTKCIRDYGAQKCL